MRYYLYLLIALFGMNIHAQQMNNDKLEQILYKVSDSIIGQKGAWQFKIDERIFMCVTDETNNRMRIMTPITEEKELTKEDMLKLLQANFHTALDVKYAVSNGILWSAYIHPLKELNEDQVKDAVGQVYYAAITYGTVYSSTNLTFPSGNREVPEKDKLAPKEKVIDKKLLRKN